MIISNSEKVLLNEIDKLKCDKSELIDLLEKANENHLKPYVPLEGICVCNICELSREIDALINKLDPNRVWNHKP